jgi:transposase
MKLTPYEAYHKNQPEEKRIEYFTLNEISKEEGVDIKILRKRVHRLKIKSLKNGANNIKYYTEPQIKSILNYLKSPKRMSSVKVTIIEMYQTGRKGRDIARDMKLSTKLAYDCIREYDDTGCVVVESKMNYLKILE